MLTLFRNLEKKEADSYSLVLCSAGIFHKMPRDDVGWSLLVREIDRNKAVDLIESYLSENREFETGKTTPVPEKFKGTFSGLWGSAIILIFYMALDGSAIAPAYGSSARHILDGELFRAVTSLFLHKDIVHLVGNMAALAVFATGVCLFAGCGAGWFMILLSGAAGNVANAFLHQTGHISIGASTAVFGALGMLASRRFFVKLKSEARKMRAWLPIASGLALLGFMGVGGKETDLSAHLFGFSAGIIIGLFYSVLMKRPLVGPWQTLCFLIVSVAVTLSWMMAP